MSSVSWTAPDFETLGDADGDNVYEVTVEVTDTGNNTATRDVTVKVMNADEPGEITLSGPQPRVDVLLTATLTDPDGGVSNIMWRWTTVQEPLSCAGSVDGVTAEDALSIQATYTPKAADDGFLCVRVRYADAEAEDKDLAQASANAVQADPSNKAPAFLDMETEGDQTAQERTVRENTGAKTDIGVPVKATDPNTEDVLQYTLGGTDVASFAIDMIDGQLSTKAALDFEDTETYTVEVTATDSSNASATVTVTIKVMDVDEPPEISLGGLAINGPSSSSYAENGTDAVEMYTASGPDAAMATWSLTGADASSFDITGGELAFATPPDFESPADMGGDNVYQITVKAYDGTYMDMQDVAVTVTNVDEAPDVVGEASIEYEENATSTVETYMAVDPEGAEVVFSWSLGGDDALDFSIDEGGVLRFASTPDFEMPADMDGDNMYSVTVQATDETGKMGTKEITVEVTDVNEVPDVAGKASIVYKENATSTVATYTAVDPDEGAEIVWSLGGDDALDFSIDEGGVLRFASTPDFEMPADMDGDNMYSVTVQATDETGKMGTKEITVEVTDVNEVPDVAGKASIVYKENATSTVATYTAVDPDEGAEIVWSLGGDDALDFSIDEGGVLRFASTPDFEMPADMDGDNMYSVTVQATDETGKMGTKEITVEVTDVNEVPDVAGKASIVYKENATSTVATYTAVDPDEGAEIVWSLGGDDALDFSIDEGGVLRFASTPDFEMPADMDGDNMYSVTVQATDETGKMGTKEITVEVTDVNEVPDVAGKASIVYKENATSTVATYTAVDPDEGAEIVWSLGGDDALDFSIDEGGVLRFASTPDFEMPADMDGDNVYQVTVVAGDGTNMDTQDVTVTVTDVDEMVTVEDPLLAEFDDNDNMMIDKDEVIQAINDYFDNVEGVTKQVVIDVINRYLDS